MNDLSNIDLCVVDGSTSLDRLNLLVKIALHSCKSISFNSIKILSGYDNLSQYDGPSNFEFMPVSINSIDEYGKFIIKDLHRYINAEYCLLFQHDGFIVNPSAWTDEFLNYDYIGAPWGKESWNKNIRVGNGGFSLRSKKFMEYCSTLDYTRPVNEDNFLCVNHHDNITSHGLKFAPAWLAAIFSIEERTEYTQDNVVPFGFHGSSRRQHLYERTLEYQKKYLSDI